mmetsp:Transcript_89383/g.252890  ORF Transcript_89383/g.252890 Transcript_89383/m.252890 type:complete len:210 (-) Transcript_89383:21-650(-)
MHAALSSSSSVMEVCRMLLLDCSLSSAACRSSSALSFSVVFCSSITFFSPRDLPVAVMNSRCSSSAAASAFWVSVMVLLKSEAMTSIMPMMPPDSACAPLYASKLSKPASGASSAGPCWESETSFFAFVLYHLSKMSMAMLMASRPACASATVNSFSAFSLARISSAVFRLATSSAISSASTDSSSASLSRRASNSAISAFRERISSTA